MIGTLLSWLHIIISVFFVISIIMDKRSTETTIAWSMVVFLFPVLGICSFLMFGVNWNKRNLIKQLPEQLFSEHLECILRDQEEFIESYYQDDIENSDNDVYKVYKLLLNSNHSMIAIHNDFDFYYDGETFFSKLLDDISNAEESIHMEYFIWRSDNIGNRLKDALIKKASEGVKVRLIFDSFGSFGRINKRYKKEMTDVGIEFKYFLDLFHPTAWIFRFNYRNHRKITVIDGKIGYTGGMNIGDEYIDGGKKFDCWRDTSVRFKGDMTMLFQSLFLTDWFNSGNEMLIDEECFQDSSSNQIKSPMQVVVSGPDSEWNAIKLMFMNMITNSNREIYIQSPYLVPDVAILEALQIAALSGVEVHIMMTGVADKLIPFYAAYTYYDDLIKAGCHIYQYKKGFLHAKNLVMDRQICTVGTTNMDIRSFKLNYEVNTVIYDEEICEKIIDQFNIDLKECIEIKKEILLELSFLKRFRNAICRIFSPIL